MSKLKEFAEFLLEVEKNSGAYQSRINPDCDWVDRCESPVGFCFLKYDKFSAGDLRLKPKEEEKKKIPLEFSDITPNMIISSQNNIRWFTSINYADKNIISVNKLDTDGTKTVVCTIYYGELMEYNYSTDSGKTWKGCFKYED